MQLFLTSFLILFLELSLIRFIPAHMILSGYFTNIIVIASFLGVGIGMLLSKKIFPLFSLLPVFLGILIGFVLYFQVQVALPTSDAIFFNDSITKIAQVEPFILFPFLYIFVTLPFIPLGFLLGKLFAPLPPLKAYSIDIAGAITGIFCFSLLSFFMTPPLVWLGIVISIFLLLQVLQKGSKKHTFLAGLVCVGILAMLIASNTPDTYWSPYYRIRLFNNGQQGSDRIYLVDVNNIAHQYISPFDKRQRFYYAPYLAFQNHFYKNILIIGAGTGADVATALNLDPFVEHIDAVEIDPKIYAIGKELNPNKPFDDHRVTVHIDDGRNFLHNTTKHYDLIEYALTDSLILSSNTSNVRLESFLFTTDAFSEVKKHLSGDGLFIMYNFYRQDWLIDKLASMTEKVFDYSPHVYILGGDLHAAVIATGPKTASLSPTSLLKKYHPSEAPDPSQDSWPFLYLKEHSIPSLYATFLPILLVISFLLFGATTLITKRIKFDFRMFFLGAAFMLLETKSIVIFGLLFGTTWIVNSIVFIGILTFVLLANFLSSKIILPRWLAYLCLFFALSMTLALPPSFFLNLPWITRLLSASIFYFSPIFFANLIFSQQFKNTADPQTSFASNLLGAVLGGFTEYTSLIVGYQWLILIILLFYALAFVTKKRILSV